MMPDDPRPVKKVTPKRIAGLILFVVVTAGILAYLLACLEFMLRMHTDLLKEGRPNG